jgi:hypothetical protein
MASSTAWRKRYDGLREKPALLGELRVRGYLAPDACTRLISSLVSFLHGRIVRLKPPVLPARAIVLPAVAAVIVGGAASAASADHTAEAAVLPRSQSAITVRLDWRALWPDQVTWTRSYIVSVLSDLDDVEVVERKLVQNQEQVGNAIAPYYGGLAGHRLAAVLREHIVIAVEIIRAAKAHDARALATAQDRGRKNADALANLLNRARNPFWDKPALQAMFYKHLEYVTMQVDYRLKQDWAAEIRAYDDGLQHVLLIADMLAEGLVQQFPEKFQE